MIWAIDCSPLEKKAQYHIEKVLKSGQNDALNASDPLAYAPQPEALIPKIPMENTATESPAAPINEENSRANLGVESMESKGKDGIYRAPRIVSMPYEEEERKKDKEVNLFVQPNMHLPQYT